MHSRYAECAAASCFPPFSYPLSAWPLYGTCGLPAIQIGPCLAALIFGQLGSVYMSVKPHQCWAVEDEFGRINTGPSYMQTSSPVFATKEGRKKNELIKWAFDTRPKTNLVLDGEKERKKLISHPR